MRAAYEKLLLRRPVAVKTATGCALGFLGDAGAQKLEGAIEYDQSRGAAFTSLATICASHGASNATPHAARPPRARPPAIDRHRCV